MKQLKTFALAVLSLLALSFTVTSCLDSNNESTELTDAQRHQAFLQMEGNYTGKLIYYAPNPDDTNDTSDTLSTSFSIQNDTTMTFHSFPLNVLAQHVVGNESLKAAMEQAQPQSMKAFTWYFDTQRLAFHVAPYSPTWTLNYGGEDHKVQLSFYQGYQYGSGSYGARNQVTGKGAAIQLVVGSIVVDGKNTSYLKQATQMLFISE